MDEGGRLVIPVGDMDIQDLAIITRLGDRYEQKQINGFKFVPLIGKMGWQ
jgi:protein-L-isoaspartate O-methyltransferase